jgi:hypothetical protein
MISSIHSHRHIDIQKLQVIMQRNRKLIELVAQSQGDCKTNGCVCWLETHKMDSYRASVWRLSYWMLLILWGLKSVSFNSPSERANITWSCPQNLCSCSILYKVSQFYCMFPSHTTHMWCYIIYISQPLMFGMYDFSFARQKSEGSAQ